MVTKRKIAVVGACGSGKSELVARLNQHGYAAVHIAQEHSFAPKMWQVISKPDMLVYLQASYATTTLRKKFDWTEKEYQEQLQRLDHAKSNADIIIDTDQLTPDEVFQIVQANLADLDRRHYFKKPLKNSNNTPLATRKGP